MSKRSNEPIWWSLFAAGGVLAALFVPVLILITGIVLPLRYHNEVASASPGGVAGVQETVHSQALVLVGNPLVRIGLFLVISLSLFHWAHRFRFTLIDLGLKGARPLIGILCYGTAIVGTILAVIVVLRIPGATG